jgi:hypothetical protein
MIDLWIDAEPFLIQRSERRGDVAITILGSCHDIRTIELMSRMFVLMLPSLGYVTSFHDIPEIRPNGLCENGALNGYKVEGWGFVTFDWRGKGTIYLANLASRLVFYDNDSSHKVSPSSGWF